MKKWLKRFGINFLKTLAMLLSFALVSLIVYGVVSGTAWVFKQSVPAGVALTILEIAAAASAFFTFVEDD